MFLSKRHRKTQTDSQFTEDAQGKRVLWRSCPKSKRKSKQRVSPTSYITIFHFTQYFFISTNKFYITTTLSRHTTHNISTKPTSWQLLYLNKCYLTHDSFLSQQSLQWSHHMSTKPTMITFLSHHIHFFIFTLVYIITTSLSHTIPHNISHHDILFISTSWSLIISSQLHLIFTLGYIMTTSWSHTPFFIPHYFLSYLIISFFSWFILNTSYLNKAYNDHFISHHNHFLIFFISTKHTIKPLSSHTIPHTILHTIPLHTIPLHTIMPTSWPLLSLHSSCSRHLFLQTSPHHDTRLQLHNHKYTSTTWHYKMAHNHHIFIFSSLSQQCPLLYLHTPFHTPSHTMTTSFSSSFIFTQSLSSHKHYVMAYTYFHHGTQSLHHGIQALHHGSHLLHYYEPTTSWQTLTIPSFSSSLCPWLGKEIMTL